VLIGAGVVPVALELPDLLTRLRTRLTGTVYQPKVQRNPRSAVRVCAAVRRAEAEATAHSAAVIKVLLLDCGGSRHRHAGQRPIPDAHIDAAPKPRPRSPRRC
jgi:hypothetical protein